MRSVIGISKRCFQGVRGGSELDRRPGPLMAVATCDVVKGWRDANGLQKFNHSGTISNTFSVKALPL